MHPPHGCQSKPHKIFVQSNSMTNKRAPQQVSLGAALLGAPLAVGFYAPPDSIPETWRADFIKRHADGALRLALFRTSRGGRALVLSAAPSAQATLHLTAGQLNSGKWQSARDSAARALSERGRLPTALTVVSERAAASCNPLTLAQVEHSLSGLVHSAGASVTGLTLVCDISESEPAFLRQSVQKLAPLLPNLATLHLQKCRCGLPPPSLLPNLRSLTLTSVKTYSTTQDIEGPHDDAYHSRKAAEQQAAQSVQPHLTQLTQLQFTGGCSGDWGPERVLNPRAGPTLPAPSNTLTDFSITDALTDPLLTALLQRAPALRRLAVGELRLQSAEHADGEWGVESLEITHPYNRPFWQLQIHAHALDMLARLPRPHEGRVRVKASHPVRIAVGEQVRTQTHTHTCARARAPAHTCAPPVAWTACARALRSQQYRDLMLRPILCLFACMCSQGLKEQTAQHLSRYTFDTEKVILQPCNLPRQHQAAALRTVLQQLSGLEAPKAAIHFGTGWHWTPAVSAALAAGMPALPDMRFVVPAQSGAGR